MARKLLVVRAERYHDARMQEWLLAPPTADAQRLGTARRREDVIVSADNIASTLMDRCRTAPHAFADHVDAVGAEVLDAWTRTHGEQQQIGAGPPAPVFTNVSVPRNNLVFDTRTGSVYAAAALPDRSAHPNTHPPTVFELLSLAHSTWGGVRVAGAPGPPAIRAPPLRMIMPADLPTWPRVPHSFPVYVVMPGFGAGLATHFVAAETHTGFGPPSLYLAVKKFTPLGPIPSEQYALGFYAVPAAFCQLMHLAAAQLFVAENVVVIDDYLGRQFSVSFVEFRQTDDWRYQVARNVLVLQYPNILSDMFATRLYTTAPTDMLPGGAARMAIPARVANLPPLMIPPPQPT